MLRKLLTAFVPVVVVVLRVVFGVTKTEAQGFAHKFALAVARNAIDRLSRA